MKRSPGYLLIEAAVAYVILTYGIVCVLPVFSLAIKANERSEETLKAAQLAQELMEEIKLRRWDEHSGRIGYPATNGSTTLGVDSGETAGVKRTFDDIDDFNGYSESPPKDPMGNPLTGFGGYSRSVTVQYVTASSFAVSSSSTPYKQVIVCVAKGGVNRACLNWLATNN
jgi:type II secretory pathway pseudopilin PulG